MLQITPGRLALQDRDGGRDDPDHAEHVGLEQGTPVIQAAVLDGQVVRIDAGVVHHHPEIVGEVVGGGIGDIQAGDGDPAGGGGRGDPLRRRGSAWWPRVSNPRSANSMATDRPIPRLAPVTRALPVISTDASILLSGRATTLRAEPGIRHDPSVIGPDRTHPRPIGPTVRPVPGAGRWPSVVALRRGGTDGTTGGPARRGRPGAPRASDGPRRGGWPRRARPWR